jgi:hypothetical protein
VRNVKVSNNKTVSKSLPGVFAVRSENWTVALLSLSSGFHPAENCPGDIAAAILPRLVEFDSIWELTNNICDRYLEPVAA